MGLGDIREVFRSRQWRSTAAFDEACRLAGWDKEWVEAIFSSVEDLHHEHGAVRHKLTKDSVALLRKMVRN